MPLRWGIVGAGKISHDFCNCLNASKPEHEILAVAARDADRARKFAEVHEIARHYGSYEELARDGDVDIVYVGSIHITHLAICRLMLQHGRHVLCEKPMTLTPRHTQELVDLARERGRFLMEGVWSRFIPALRVLKAEVAAGSIGEVRAVIATICQPLMDVERLQKRELGGGVLMDLGIYVLQLAHDILGEKPTGKHFVGHLTDSGVDDYCSMTLQYQDGRQVAQLICDSRYDRANIATVSGTKGTITLGDPFWKCLEVETPNGKHTFRHTFTPRTGRMNFSYSENFIYEIQHVAECLRQGKLESDIVPLSHSLYLAGLAAEVRAAVGVKYDTD